MMRRVIQISDRQKGRLLRKNSYLEVPAASAGEEWSTEVQRALDSIAKTSTAQNCASMEEKHEQLKEKQKEAFDEIYNTCSSEPQQGENGKLFFLQGHAGTSKTYLLSLLREKLESKGILVEVAATTEIAASQYRNVRTAHSLLGLGVEDEDASEQHAKISRHGPQSQRAALLREVQLCFIDKSSRMQRILFEHVDAVKDMRCF